MNEVSRMIWTSGPATADLGGVTSADRPTQLRDNFSHRPGARFSQAHLVAVAVLDVVQRLVQSLYD